MSDKAQEKCCLGTAEVGRDPPRYSGAELRLRLGLKALVSGAESCASTYRRSAAQS
jgi:hypothetical protein